MSKHLPIHELIRQASSLRINAVFAKEVPLHCQLRVLMEDAFMVRIPEGWYTEMLREANRRLQVCALTGDYVAPPEGDAFYLDMRG